MKFLSIDFDVCLWKDINLYNNMVGTYKEVDELFQKNPMLQNIRFDADLYCRLTDLIVKIGQRLPADKIHFITSHEEIVPLIQVEDRKNSLVNIDNHHDIEYNYRDYIRVPQCGSWVKYLFQEQKIENYVHIGTDNSDRPFDEDIHFVDEFCNISQYNFELLVDEIDELFICLSPAWVPRQYHGLFKAWAATLGQLKNCKYTY